MNHTQITHQERQDRLTAAQALVELSSGDIDHTPAQIVPSTFAPYSLFQFSQLAPRNQTMPPYVVYDRDFNDGLTFNGRRLTGRTTTTSNMSSNDLHLSYLHPSTSAFACPQYRQPQSQPQPQPQSVISRYPSTQIITRDRTFTNTRQSHTEHTEHTSDLEAHEAASILLTLQNDNHSPRQPQPQPQIDLLSVGGRSGLRSRGVPVRRFGAEPVDERLSTEILESVSQSVGPIARGNVREERLESESVSSLTSLEDLEEIKEEDEDRADTSGVRRAGAAGKNKGKATGKGQGKKKPGKAKAKKKKTTTNVPRDYQRYAVRDEKGKFVRK